MKYGNVRVEIDGEKFDSKKEAARWQELILLERAHVITNLRRQVKYELIPSQYDGRKLLERGCSYIADFVYEENGQVIAEDTKGFKTRDYIIKRKLMLYQHGIQIREV